MALSSALHACRPSRKKPPCHRATTASVPANMSRVTSMLWPICPGFSDAHHEIMRWVTSFGDQAPLRVQSALGWLASPTSTRVSADDPFITTSASCAAGWAVQVAGMAAHDGTKGVGDGEGDGDGLGMAL